MPISVDEIVAQRDLLRAEFAADRRRVEQDVERARDALARAMADSGRRAAEIGRLTGELAVVTQAAAEAQDARAAAERARNEAEAESGGLQKALFDSTEGETRWRERHADATRTIRTLETDVAARIETLGAFERAQAEDVRLRRELERAGTQAALDLSVARTRGETLGAQVESLEDAARLAAARESDLRTQIAAFRAATVSDAELALLRQTVVHIGQEVVRLTEEGERASTPAGTAIVRAPLH